VGTGTTPRLRTPHTPGGGGGVVPPLVVVTPPPPVKGCFFSGIFWEIFSGSIHDCFGKQDSNFLGR